MVGLPVLYCFAFVHVIARKRRYLAHVAEFDGPHPHWLMGNLLDMPFAPKGLLFHVSCATHYRTVYRVWFGAMKSAVVCCHPDTIKSILSVNRPKDNFIYPFLQPWLGTGLLIANGTQWSSMRRLLTPAFHFDMLQNYVDIFNQCTEVLLKKWRKRTEPVEVVEDIDKLTLDCILKCAFSFNSNCQERDTDSYVKAVKQAVRLIIKRLMSPLVHSSLVYNMTSDGRRFHQYVKTIIEKADTIISARRQNKENKEEHKTTKDFLDILLEAKRNNGRKLSDAEICSEVNTFLVEGYDTTSCGFSWVLYNLAKYPEHQEKCREEVDQILQGKHKVQWSDLSSLNYVTMCIKESLRTHPSVAMVARELDKSVNLDGRSAPKGTWVIVNIYALHHNPHVWDNPEDQFILNKISGILICGVRCSERTGLHLLCEVHCDCGTVAMVFDPSRFLPENSQSRSPHAFIPFSSGSRNKPKSCIVTTGLSVEQNTIYRNCIGQNFAMAEMKIFVAKILQEFKLNLVPGQNVEATPDLLLRPKPGIFLNLEPRMKRNKTRTRKLSASEGPHNR